MMRLLLFTCSLLTSTTVIAGGLAVGNALPTLTIAESGELLLDAESRSSYRPWHSHQECGRPQVLQHLAARLSVKNMNKPFTDALQTRLQPDYGGRFRVTTIININDALWGSGTLIESQLKRNKKKYPDSIMVADQDGIMRANWGLQEESSAIILVASNCDIRFIREGALSPPEIEEALDLLRQDLQGGSG